MPTRRWSRWTAGAWSGRRRRHTGKAARSRLDAVLPELVGLLQRRGRVTYRSLMQIFGLDETLLHALRDELLFQRLAVDEDGKGLVWAGAALRHPPDTHPPPDDTAVASLSPPYVPVPLPCHRDQWRCPGWRAAFLRPNVGR